MNKLIISLAAAILSLPVAADEGMWLLPLLKGQRFPEMQALGLKLQDYDIYSPDSASLKDAVVISEAVVRARSFRRKDCS